MELRIFTGLPLITTSTRLSASQALRIGIYYLVFGAAWILVSDTLLPTLVQETGQWQTYKGLAFILASAAIIYLLVRQELAARGQLEEELHPAERSFQLMFEQSVAGVLRPRGPSSTSSRAGTTPTADTPPSSTSPR